MSEIDWTNPPDPPDGHDNDCEYRRRHRSYGPCWCFWRWRVRENRRIIREMIEWYERHHPEMVVYG